MTSSPSTRPPRRVETRFALLALALLGLAALIVLWRFDPVQTDWYPRCLVRSWLGIHCPGCGTTRALHALLHGDFVAALRWNPLLVIGVPLVVLCWLVGRVRRQGRVVSTPERGRSTIPSPKLALTVLIVVTAYFFARNLPSPGRGWLAPPDSIGRPDGGNSGRALPGPRSPPPKK